MKLILLIAIMSFVFGSTELVKMEVKPGSVEVEKNHPASFRVYLRAGDGIHVNTEPAITVKSATEGVEFTIAKLPKAGDYLDLNRPIEISCRVTGLKPGTHRADFVLSFTYCSDKEGWCRMGRDSSMVELKVKK